MFIPKGTLLVSVMMDFCLLQEGKIGSSLLFNTGPVTDF